MKNNRFNLFNIFIMDVNRLKYLITINRMIAMS